MMPRQADHQVDEVGGDVIQSNSVGRPAQFVSGGAILSLLAPGLMGGIPGISTTFQNMKSCCSPVHSPFR